MKYDLIVIGGGSGGVRASRMAAQAGKKVALVEYQALGGTCVNVGCVPKKLFVYASHFAESFSDAKGFGWTLDKPPEFSWSTLIKNKNDEIAHLNSIYGNLLTKAGVTLIQGKAKFKNENTLVVNRQELTGESILIATGSKSFVPDFPGNKFVLTSNDMFYLEALPKKILIVGGGYIAVEFAGIMAGLGVDTTLVYRGELFLRGFDNEIRKFLHQEMLKKGVKILFNKSVVSICKTESYKKDSSKNEKSETEKLLKVEFDQGESDIFDAVLYATGRIPNTQELGLEKLNLKLEKGAIVVGEDFQSSLASIYALGDVINRVQLTPVAIEEAMVFVNQRYGNNSKTMNYDLIPSAVFSQPSLACVGLTEEQAIERGFNISVFVSEFEPMKFSLTDNTEGNTERTLMKLIVDKTNDRILGAHMVGDSAAEIIQGIAIALKAGATKKMFDDTVGIHPSSAEEFVTMRTPRTGN